MFREVSIILAVLFYGCSANNKPEEKLQVDTTSKHPIEKKANKHNFNLLTKTICEQTTLSNQLDFMIYLTRYSDTVEIHDSCVLKVLIRNKKTKEITDSIFLTSLFYLSNTFEKCDSNTTSFTTGVNSKRLIADNYFGDLIVSDLNFDNRDDIAIINDYGGNGGPSYSYYIQGDSSHFIFDSFLTDSVMFFPTTINKSRQQLITYVHAGACCLGKHVYKLDSEKKIWRQTQHKILGLKSGT